MVNNVVGCLSPDLNYDLLCEKILKGGLTIISQSYIRDNKIMITPKNGESYIRDNRIMITPKNGERIEDIVLSKCFFFQKHC